MKSVTTLTAAQIAQQNNRGRGGRYAEKTQGDPGGSVLAGADAPIPVDERIADALRIVANDPRQEHPVLQQARAALTMSGPNTREGFKTWAHRNNGKRIDTVQVTIGDGHLRQVWTPGERKLNAGASYISWGDENSRSRRDFAGVRALHSTDTQMVGWDEDMEALVCYRVVEG